MWVFGASEIEDVAEVESLLLAQVQIEFDVLGANGAHLTHPAEGIRRYVDLGLGNLEEVPAIVGDLDIGDRDPSVERVEFCIPDLEPAFHELTEDLPDVGACEARLCQDHPGRAQKQREEEPRIQQYSARSLHCIASYLCCDSTEIMAFRAQLALFCRNNAVFR